MVFSLLTLFFSFVHLSCENPFIVQIVEPKTAAFESNGGSRVESQTIYKGQQIKRPPDPSRSGYMFIAWYSDDETFLQEWDFSAIPNKDVTLYAKWKEGEIHSAAITVTVPAAGAVPTTGAGGEVDFTVTNVSWTPDDNPFKPATVYRVTVTLTANESFIFADDFTADINGDNAAVANNPGPTVELSYQFKSTGANVDAPAAAIVGVTSVMLEAVSASTGQSVEYAINSGESAPADGWQSDVIFNGLTAGTAYYFFARSASNSDYYTGAPSAGTKITTHQQAGDDAIVTYWADDTGGISIGAAGHTFPGNIVTVTNGGSITFTAAAAGYTNHKWTLNGIDTGVTTAEYTFDTSDGNKEPGRNYIIGLTVKKGDNFYSTQITVRIIEE